MSTEVCGMLAAQIPSQEVQDSTLGGPYTRVLLICVMDISPDVESTLGIAELYQLKVDHDV